MGGGEGEEEGEGGEDGELHVRRGGVGSDCVLGFLLFMEMR